jgi:hypothetical protein
MQGAKKCSATTDLVTIANRAAAAAAAAGQSGLNPGHHGMATNYEMSGMLMCSISCVAKIPSRVDYACVVQTLQRTGNVDCFRDGLVEPRCPLPQFMALKSKC